MKTIVYNREMKDFILDLFDKKKDDEGFIVEKNTGIRVIKPSGEFVKYDDFVGVTPGSEIFLTNDLPSLIKYANREAVENDVAV